MTELYIDDEFLSWVKNNIEPLFAEEGIEFTDNARYVFALAMQAQIDEGLIPDNYK